MKSWYTIRARGPGAQGSRTEVLIYDEIGAYGVTAKGFLAELGALPDDAAIDLRLNSPGGSAFASDVVAREVALLKKKGVPVVVSMGDVAASGGYYIAAPANLIMADPSTITGSIGVFGLFLNYEDLAKKIQLGTDGAQHPFAVVATLGGLDHGGGPCGGEARQQDGALHLG